jgi:hypothetical protein
MHAARLGKGAEICNVSAQQVGDFWAAQVVEFDFDHAI